MTFKFTVSSNIVIEGMDPLERQVVKNSLTVMNPKWDSASRMNRGLWNIPPSLKYYVEDLIGPNTLVVPVGILSQLKKVYPKAEVIDNRYETKVPLNLQFRGTLYPYQVLAVEEMLKDPNGVLCLPTGGGKTHSAINMICQLKQETLILVNTQELANQFLDKLVQLTNLKKEDIGIIGGGRRDIKPITVGLLQTVVDMNIPDLKFGLVICDEVHIAPAETYAKAIGKFDSKYKYGLSATPERADGLTKVIFWVTGPLRYTVLPNQITTIIKPTIRTIDTNYFFPLFDSSEYQAMITDLSRDEERNKLIINTLVDYPTQQIVLLCQRKEQIELLQKEIKDSVILTSDMSKKERASVMAGLLNGTHRIIISSYQLFSTGIDVPTLEILFLCAPIKSTVKVKQSAGRLMRVVSTLPNKQPVIVDFIDKKVELLKYQGYQRKRIYRTL